MKTTRRSFFRLSAAATFATAGGRLTAAAGAPPLKLGIISDVHINDTEEADFRFLVKALEHFRDAHVDGVIIPGDIADLGAIEEFEAALEAWKRVFPGNRLPDGSPVERLFIYGNHDCPPFSEDGNHVNVKSAKKRWPEDWKSHVISADPAGAWKRLMGEDYAPIYARKVKGYVFIGCHWGHEKELGAFLEANEAKLGLRGPKPFFYAQHPHPRDTVNSAHGSYSWGRDAGLSTAALAKYPNAVAFSGHSHYPLTNDQTIWQGAFTSVGCSSTSYAGWLNGRDDGEWSPDECPEPVPVAARLRQQCRQGMVLNVWPDRMIFERRDFVQDAPLGPDWVCPLPACVDDASRPYSFAASEARAETPSFVAGAVPTVEMRMGKNRKGKEGPILAVKYPAARSNGPTGRLVEYEVTVENLKWGFTRIHTQKRAMAKGYCYADETVIKEDECLFMQDELPLNTPVRFKVTPLNCFEKGGTPIFTKEMTLPVKMKPEAVGQSQKKA